MEKQIIGVDLFSGAGGLSLGAEMAGITVKYAIEIDSFAAETYKVNHPLTSIIHADIRKITGFPYNSFRNQLILFGGAPCQGFSSSNRRTNTRNNPDNWLYKEFIRMVLFREPLCGLNVPTGLFILDKSSTFYIFCIEQ